MFVAGKITSHLLVVSKRKKIFNPCLEDNEFPTFAGLSGALEHFLVAFQWFSHNSRDLSPLSTAAMFHHGRPFDRLLILLAFFKVNRGNALFWLILS